MEDFLDWLAYIVIVLEYLDLFSKKSVKESSKNSFT